jgi:ribose 5-phosphate isomerase A
MNTTPNFNKENLDKAYYAKRESATKALDYIENNMRVGLGTGSTANIFIDLLAHKVKTENLNIHCVATSNETAKRALDAGLFLYPDASIDYLDVTVDGADEFDSDLRLIKGGGGALLREKIIAQATHKFIVIADDSKFVDTLGAFPLPVECVYYETKMLLKHLEAVFNRHAHSSACEFVPEFRKQDKNASNINNDNVFLTNLGHIIIDLDLKIITDPESLVNDLRNIAGIVEHGLFLKEASTILTDNRVLNKG